MQLLHQESFLNPRNDNNKSTESIFAAFLFVCQFISD